MGLLDDLCRLCTLKLDRQLSHCIFTPENAHLLLMISECLPIMVTEDDCYPKLVCRSCAIQLGVSFDFQRKCVSAGKVFDEIMVAEENRNKEIAHSLLLAAVKQEVVDDVSGEENENCAAAADKISQRVKEEPNNDELTELSTDPEDSVEFTCDHCSQEFQTKPDIRRHIRAKHVSKPKKPVKKIPLSKTPPKNATSEKPWACELCPSTYTHKRCLVVHMKKHNGGRYACDICQKKFETRSSLIGHIRIHTGEKPFKCKSCRKRFRTKELVRLHNMRYHSGGKHHQCAECKKCFETRFCLNAHKRIHGKVKPHVCKLCEKGYRARGQLVIHERRCHTGEKPFRCDACPSTFRTNGELKVHRRIHTGEKPYKCEECFKLFRTTAHLLLHTRTHTGERPHRCAECGKGFCAKSDVTKHMVTHTREKRFPCPTCGLKFPFKARLADHMRLH